MLLPKYYYTVFYITYLVVAILFVLYVVLKEKPKHKIINFSILVWLVSFESLNSSIAWGLFPVLWKFRRGTLLLAMILLILFTLSSLSRRQKSDKVPMLIYEKHLYAYLIISIFILYLHSYVGNLLEERFAYFSRVYFTAFLINTLIKRFMTIELIRSIFKVIIFIGICTSIAGIIQFYLDSNFLRISNLNVAYGSHFRSSGVFLNPIGHGLFLIISVFTVAYTIKDNKLKFLLIFLFSFNIVLIFSRGMWLAFLGVVLLHLFILYRKKYKNYMKLVFSFVLILLSFMLTSINIQEIISSGEGASARVFEDTVTVRFGYYGFIIKSIPKSLFLGFGDIQNNSTYFNGMVELNQGLTWALGKEGGIHNIILEEAFLRGIIAMFFFLSFFILFFKYNINRSIKDRNSLFFISNYYLMSFLLYEQTVSGFLTSNSGIMTMFFASLVSGVNCNKIDIKEFEISS